MVDKEAKMKKERKKKKTKNMWKNGPMNEFVLHIGQYNQNRDKTESEHENIDI